MDAHYLTLAFIAIVAAWLLLAAVALALQAWRARRRRVLGTRVRRPEWHARKLRNGQWIVERNRS